MLDLSEMALCEIEANYILVTLKSGKAHPIAFADSETAQATFHKIRDCVAQPAPAAKAVIHD